MRQLLALGLVTVFASANVSAQRAITTRTFETGVDGIANCTLVHLVVRRVIQNDGASQTTLQYSLKDCEPGSNNPTRLVANFTATIPDTAYTPDTKGARLIYQAPDGPVDVQWELAAKDSSISAHNTYSATWIWDTPTLQRKDTEDVDTRGAIALGILAGRIIDGRSAFVMVGSGGQVIK